MAAIKAERSAFELEITAAALKQDLPVLGICGGAQAINVVLGGSLYQDIGAQVPNAQEHQQSRKAVKRGHRITIQPRTLLRKIVGRSHAEVNTTHHQAVKTLGRGLIVNAIAGDGIVEGIESTGHPFVIGVQWHPEVLAPRSITNRADLFRAGCARRPAPCDRLDGQLRTMLTEVLNAQNYQSNLFALPPFITASILLALGFMVRDREQRSRVSTLHSSS